MDLTTRRGEEEGEEGKVNGNCDVTKQDVRKTSSFTIRNLMGDESTDGTSANEGKRIIIFTIVFYVYLHLSRQCQLDRYLSYVVTRINNLHSSEMKTCFCKAIGNNNR